MDRLSELRTQYQQQICNEAICVYHFALHELAAAVHATANEAVIESLETMVEGNRLRDIADLPFDLVV